MIQQVPLEYLDEDALARDPVGTGPYKCVERAAGDHIDIERNDDDRDWHDHEWLRAATVVEAFQVQPRRDRAVRVRGGRNQISHTRVKLL
jgi:ABC-type transport system substrate-binding protein